MTFPNTSRSKEVTVKYTFRVACFVVQHSDGGAGLVVDVQQQIVAPMPDKHRSGKKQAYPAGDHSDDAITVLSEIKLV